MAEKIPALQNLFNKYKAEDAERESKTNEGIVTNEKGGKQSAIDGRMTEVPPIGWIEVSKVMGLGSINYPREADGTPNWHNIDSMSNLDHGLLHAAKFLELRNQPIKLPTTLDEMREELSHHAARALMALEMFIKENY